MVHELIEARDEKRLLRFQKQLAKYKLLIIDELGFVPLSKTGAELLFEVFSQRYERGSTLVTTNLPFDEWTEVFGSERLTGALLERTLFERLRDEYGFTGKITIVKDYICGVRQRRREMFVPLTHPPGHAQVDFGEALAVIGGVERKIHFLAMSLPHSDACFVKAYPGETTEAFCDGHVSGFSFFGGVPRSILYDNTRIAVARILGDGKRQRTRVFSELRSHYLFEDRFGRPGKGNDKGKVEGIVGYCRRNFLVPMPRFRNFDDLNTHLEACCARR